MPLSEMEINVFAGETLKIAGPAHIKIHGGLSTSMISEGIMGSGSKAAIATANGTKSAMLFGGGKISAIKTTGVFSGSVMKGVGAGAGGMGFGAIMPTILTIGAATAVGYALYRLNDKVMRKLTSY
jgi:hypothetical protein